MLAFNYTDPMWNINYVVQELREIDAIAIADWEYPPPYSMYNLQGSPLAIAEFIRGPYYAVYVEERLSGFYCYGSPARITHETSAYFYKDVTYLDIGLGLHPRLCGYGYGLGFFNCGLAFGKARLSAKRFRLTAAQHNQRAIKVYERAGFSGIGCFARQGLSEPMEYVVMTKD